MSMFLFRTGPPGKEIAGRESEEIRAAEKSSYYVKNLLIIY